MKELRIIFMGTPEFAVASLNALVKGNYNVVAVITAPDRPAGRGRKINQSAVKKYAITKEIPILQPNNLKSPEFLKELERFNANLQIVVAFRMLPKQVWSMPDLGTFNLHASLLPEYRGAAPINWAIINGETQTGVTTFFINEDIDTGAIIMRREVKINNDMSAGELHDKLMDLGAKTLVETVDLIKNGKTTALDQNSGTYKEAPKLNKDNCRIHWDQPSEIIYNQIRGLSPYPGAWTSLSNNEQEIEMKIYGANMLVEHHNLVPGAIMVSKKNLRIATQNGFIDIKDLKLAGKKRMDAVSLLNGYIFYEGSKVV